MLTAPSLGYSLLAPMLIVLAGAVIGVLVEAFVGKARRTAIQVTLSIGVLLLSFQQLWRIKDLSSTTAAVGFTPSGYEFRVANKEKLTTNRSILSICVKSKTVAPT